MQNTKVWFLSLLLVLVFFTSYSIASHEITYFRDNKKGAVSISFDDGYSSQITNAFSLLADRNLKATFFAITMPSWINYHVSWDTWGYVKSQGHEIGSHTVNHPDLTTLPELDMRWELSESQRMINQNVTQPASPEEVIFAVNCGGPEYTDKVGIIFQADTLFSGGRKRVTEKAIKGTEDYVLYQSERYGNFSYSIPISNGNYWVTLKFAETLYNASKKRIFDVQIEGVEVVSDLDLFVQVDKNTAYDVTLPINVTDGILNIDFSPHRGNATVSAIIVATPSKSCLSLAYPFGLSNAQVQNTASQYYIAAKGTWTPEGGFLNYYEDGPNWKAVDFLNIGSYEIDAHTTLADLDDYLNLAEQRHAWFCVHFNEVTNNDFFVQFIDHLLAKNAWVDTFGAIVRYMQERLSSTLTVLSETASEIRLHLFHSLDPTIYDLPLTIRSSVPSHWFKIRVKQGNLYQTVIPVRENGQTVVYYNATPNGEEIVLREDVTFAVNCGGPEYVDKEGLIYQSDTLFSEGRTRVSKTMIEGTEDGVLYQSERYGDFSYNIPVSNGDYTVILKFAETRQRAAGRSVFDVVIQGREVLSHLDLFAQAGKNKAYDVSIPINVMDGVLNIHFVTETGQAKVSAIIVNPL